MDNKQTEQTETPLWAIIELMGHVRTGARVAKDNQFGSVLLRADVPQHDGSFVTQLINPSSIYRLTICEEALAREAAKSAASRPMDAWELKHLLPAPNANTTAVPVVTGYEREPERDEY